MGAPAARALLLLMPAAASPSTPAAVPKKKVTKEWRKGVPHLPAQTHASVNAALAGAILSLAAEDDELTRGELAKRAYKAVGSRENKAENVLCNLEYCEDNGIEYDPASRYGNNKTGPRATETRSPAAAGCGAARTKGDAGIDRRPRGTGKLQSDG